MDFAETYGPWAIIAGASEGVGSAFATAVAERGVNVLLLSRRQAVLDDVAAQITSATGVEARTLAVDLAEPTATDQIVAATSDLDVGLLMYCAGADPKFQYFLDGPVDDALSLVQRNCIVPMRLCHHFAPPMVARGRGGIIVVSSMAAMAGAPHMAAYGGSKAFDIVFTESLWAELHPKGVDVLSLVLGMTDTPALRRLQEERGQPFDPDAPVPDAATVDEVVADAIEQLPNGPSRIVGEHLRGAALLLGGMPRNDAVGFMVQASADSMG